MMMHTFERSWQNSDVVHPSHCPVPKNAPRATIVTPFAIYCVRVLEICLALSR